MEIPVTSAATRRMMAILSIALILTEAAYATKSLHLRGKRILQHRPNNKSKPIKDSCYSSSSNDTLPAAHIKGSGTLWNATDGKYVPQWDCKTSTPGRAFVAGGMWFNQHDKSLYVPKCGWYYVTSQVTFQSNSELSQKYSHTLKIDRNCNATATQPSTSSYSHNTFTMTGPLDMDTSGKSSTVVSDMVKICTRGRIYVSILTSNSACCPYGDEAATMITAYLIREADCFWPITSFPHPIEQFQETTP